MWLARTVENGWEIGRSSESWVEPPLVTPVYGLIVPPEEVVLRLRGQVYILPNEVVRRMRQKYLEILQWEFLGRWDSVHLLLQQSDRQQAISYCGKKMKNVILNAFPARGDICMKCQYQYWEEYGY